MSHFVDNFSINWKNLSPRICVIANNGVEHPLFASPHLPYENEVTRKAGPVAQYKGKVKWFNNAKGYGFINEDGKTEDLFAHYSAIKMDGYKTLKAGQAVTFNIIQGPKGLHAVEINDALAKTTTATATTASTSTHGTALS